MQIVYFPDPVLLRKADDLVEVPADIEEIVAEMRRVMELERGIGLAAPQVGLSKRIILIGPTSEIDEERVLFNPKITRFAGRKEWDEEGCLSFPGIYGDVLRHTEIEVAYRDIGFAPQTLVATDFLARVLQHEIDHIDGRLFVTKMRESDRIANKARLQELRERYEAMKA